MCGQAVPGGAGENPPLPRKIPGILAATKGVDAVDLFHAVPFHFRGERATLGGGNLEIDAATDVCASCPARIAMPSCAAAGTATIVTRTAPATNAADARTNPSRRIGNRTSEEQTGRV